MAQSRRESNKKYYEKHKKRWRKYNRKRRMTLKRKVYGPGFNYQPLTPKQKTFKRAVERGIEPIEAVKKAYPGVHSPSTKLSSLKRNPILNATVGGYVADMIDAGFTTKYMAKSQFDWTERANKEGSTPHDVRNAIIIIDGFRKTQGWEVERSEKRSLNLNINVGPEQAKFMENVPEEEEEDVIDV